MFVAGYNISQTLNTVRIFVKCWLVFGKDVGNLCVWAHSIFIISFSFSFI